MGKESTCGSCGAAISEAAFVCSFCGAPTGSFASSEEEELQMLRELAKAAQHVANPPSGGDDAGRDKKIAEDLSRFWAVAPLPTRPGALRQAATEACAGITGKRDGNYDITNGQLALLSRAQTCLAILKTMPDQAPVVVSLGVLITQKNKLLHPAWYQNPKTRFWLIVALVFGLLCIPTIVLMNKDSQKANSGKEYRVFPGFIRGMGTLQSAIRPSVCRRRTMPAEALSLCWRGTRTWSVGVPGTGRPSPSRHGSRVACWGPIRNVREASRGSIKA